VRISKTKFIVELGVSKQAVNFFKIVAALVLHTQQPDISEKNPTTTHSCGLGRAMSKFIHCHKLESGKTDKLDNVFTDAEKEFKHYQIHVTQCYFVYNNRIYYLPILSRQATVLPQYISLV